MILNNEILVAEVNGKKKILIATASVKYKTNKILAYDLEDNVYALNYNPLSYKHTKFALNNQTLTPVNKYLQDNNLLPEFSIDSQINKENLRYIEQIINYKDSELTK